MNDAKHNITNDNDTTLAVGAVDEMRLQEMPSKTNINCKEKKTNKNIDLDELRKSGGA